MKTIKKSVLKENWYYEYDDIYDSLPEELSVPEYKTEIFNKTISHRDILSTYKVEPYESVGQAFAVAADIIPTLKNDCKGRLVYFKRSGELCRLRVWRNGDGVLRVGVGKVGLGDEWDAGDGVSLSTKSLENSENALGSLDKLTLDDAVRVCKMHGLKVIKTTITEEEL